MQARVQPLESVIQPINKANGLPNESYVDPAEFKNEIKKIFYPNWFCLGFGKDVPNRGDVAPIDFAGIPLLITRDRDDTIRVFNNVCRHRGMKLVEEPQNIVGVIRCPYHSWCYKLNGDLYATPHVGGAGHNKHASIDPEKTGLFEVRTHVWLDMIFINLSGGAPDFDVHAEKLFTRWHEFKDQKIYHGGDDSSIELSVNSNWKLPIENTSEYYHLPWVHPGLNSYSRLQDHYYIVEENNYSGTGTMVYNPQLDESGREFAAFPGLSEKWNQAAEYISFFPNIQIGVHKDHIFVIHVTPVSVDETKERVEIYYADPLMSGDDWADLRQARTDMWTEVFQEDIFAVEGMQKGRHAPDFDGGRFSPTMDIATHCFHQWVARQLLN